MNLDKTNLIEFVKNVQYSYLKRLSSFNKEKIKKLDIYYTPYDIVVKIINYLKEVIENNKEKILNSKTLIIEPSAGTGVFITGLYQNLEHFIKNSLIVVNDIDKEACDITKKAFEYLGISNSIVLNENYLSKDFIEKIKEQIISHDLVIVLSNPPYGSSKKEEGLLYKDFIKKSLEYFHDKKFIMFFVVPESFREKIFYNQNLFLYIDFIPIGGNVRTYNKDKNLFGVTIPIDIVVISNFIDTRKKVTIKNKQISKINTKDLFIKGFFGYKTGNDKQKVTFQSRGEDSILYQYRVLDFRYLDKSLVVNNSYYNTIQIQDNWALILYDNRIINNTKKIVFATHVLSDLHTGTSTVDYCIPVKIENGLIFSHNIKEIFIKLIEQNMSIENFFYFVLGYLFFSKNIEDIVNKEKNYFFCIDLEKNIDFHIEKGKEIVNNILYMKKNDVNNDVKKEEIFLIDKTFFPVRNVIFLDKAIKLDNTIIYIKDNVLFKKIVYDYKNNVKYFGNINPFWNYIFSRINNKVAIDTSILYTNLLLYTML